MQTNGNHSSATKSHSCSHSALSEICLWLGINKGDINRLEALVQVARIQHEGDIVFR